MGEIFIAWLVLNYDMQILSTKYRVMASAVSASEREGGAHTLMQVRYACSTMSYLITIHYNNYYRVAARN